MMSARRYNRSAAEFHRLKIASPPQLRNATRVGTNALRQFCHNLIKIYHCSLVRYTSILMERIIILHHVHMPLMVHFILLFKLRFQTIPRTTRFVARRLHFHFTCNNELLRFRILSVYRLPNS